MCQFVLTNKLGSQHEGTIPCRRVVGSNSSGRASGEEGLGGASSVIAVSKGGQAVSRQLGWRWQKANKCTLAAIPGGHPAAAARWAARWASPRCYRPIRTWPPPAAKARDANHRGRGQAEVCEEAGGGAGSPASKSRVRALSGWQFLKLRGPEARGALWTMAIGRPAAAGVSDPCS